MPISYYFRAPTFDISPESPTAPKLGSIFPSLKRLTGPLNQYDHVSIPPDLRNESAKSDFSDTTGKKIKGRAGVHVDSTIGVGSGDLVYEFAKDKKNVYCCELLETEEFEPNEDLVAQCINASQRVQNFIAESFLGNKRVYMITGLKIATGFSTMASESSEQDPKLKIGFNAAAFGVPVESGPQFDISLDGSREVSHGRSLSKIVFAYRAIKISPSDGRPKYKDISGGQYGLGDDNSEEEQAWEVYAVDEQDRVREFPDSTLIAIEHEDKSS